MTELTKDKYFATLDDSMASENGFYVYSHALVIDEYPFILQFYDKNPKKLYTYEDEIVDFIEKNIYKRRLYACQHYEIYPKAMQYIFEIVNKNTRKFLPGKIKESFSVSHNTAKQAGKSKLEAIRLFGEISLNNPQSLKTSKPIKTFYGHDRLF